MTRLMLSCYQVTPAPEFLEYRVKMFTELKMKYDEWVKCMFLDMTDSILIKLYGYSSTTRPNKSNAS